MSQYTAIQTDIIDEVTGTLDGDSTWESVSLGNANIEHLKYPSVHIIPDRVSHVEGNEYDVFLTINFYFSDIPQRLTYKDNLVDVEGVIEDVIKQVSTLESIGEYKLEAIDNFVGAAGGNIILGVGCDFKFTKLVDFSKI